MGNSDGFSDAEMQAMRERAAELRAERGGKKKADNLQALLNKIAGLEGDDQKIGVLLHQVVTEVAPHLAPRTWYGMPAYEIDGKVLVFFQPSSQFGVRYSTIGFQDNAVLDDGDMWPISYAVPAYTEALRDKLVELVTRALG